MYLVVIKYECVNVCIYVCVNCKRFLWKEVWLARTQHYKHLNFILNSCPYPQIKQKQKPCTENKTKEHVIAVGVGSTLLWRAPVGGYT